jgi:hypothetical protein
MSSMVTCQLMQVCSGIDLVTGKDRALAKLQLEVASFRSERSHFQARHQKAIDARVDVMRLLNGFAPTVSVCSAFDSRLKVYFPSGLVWSGLHTHTHTHTHTHL